MHRRSISTSYSLLHRRFHPSFAHILPHDANDKAHSAHVRDSPRPQTGNSPQQQFNRNYSNAIVGFGVLFHGRGVSNFLPMDIGHSLRRYSSSMIGEESDKVEYISDPASVWIEKGMEAVGISDPGSVLTEKGMEAVGISDPGSVLTEKGMEAVVSQAPVASEVAVAAADSVLPVAFLQYFIDGVHNLTGLNWWAAIALTTIFIRSATVPLLISQLKATSKLTQMRPRLEEIKQQMEASSDPVARLEAHKRMKELFNEYGVSPLTPLKGLFIQGPIFISFYFAIVNMVEKVPSFKGGGAFWFSDLTTPDSLYIFPVLTALTFWITVELNMQEGLEGNPIAGTMKKISRVFAVLAVPLTMAFPKAIFCYWITSNLFSLLYGLVIRQPLVRKLVDLPEIDLQPPTAMHPTVSGGSKSLFGESISSASEDSQTPMDQPKPTDTSMPSSPSSISQKIDDLERAAKGRKKT